MPNFLKIALRTASRNLLVLVALGGMATVALAFTEPSVGPTGGTVYAPVNTGGTSQTKSGNFTSSGTLTGNIVNGTSQMCLAGGCISSWSVGDITAVLAGAGISGGASSGAATLSLATQSCSGTDFVKSIGGAITCATPAGGGSQNLQQVTDVGNTTSKSIGVGSPSMPATAGSFVTSRNLYTSSDGGTVVGFGELGQARTDYSGALIMGCGWDAASNTAGCITSLPVVFQQSATGNDPYSQVTAGTLIIKQRTPDSRYGRLTHTGASGNFHIDSYGGGNTYINWFGGSSVNIGNGAQGYGPIYASAFNIGSSIKLKKDISASPYGLQEILKLEPKRFHYINDPSETLKIGFIAEEVATIIPDVISFGDDGTPKGIDYGQLTTVLVGAVKEQQKEIESLKARLDALEAR